MNILVVSAIFPYPLRSGGHVRLYNLLKLVSKKHSVTLLAFVREEGEGKYTKELPFLKRIKTVHRGRARELRYIFRSLTGEYPWLLTTYDNAEMKNAIKDIISQESIDLIHIEPGYVWPSLPPTHLPIVVSEHNIEHHIYEGFARSHQFPFLSQIMRNDITKMKKCEHEIWNKASEIIAVSKVDADEIHKVTSSNVTVVPNGVDLETFTFTKEKIMTEDIKALFVGDFRWIQNRDAIEYLVTELWPLLYHKYPNGKLTIIGRDLPKNIEESLPGGTKYIPWVENIASVYATQDMLLAPIRVGGGTKYKILEAMASGLPIVTTEKGTEGLVDGAIHTVFIPQKKEEWTTIVEQMIRHPHEYEEKRKKARKLIEKSYSWEHIAAIQEKVWATAYAKK